VHSIVNIVSTVQIYNKHCFIVAKTSLSVACEWAIIHLFTRVLEAIIITSYFCRLEASQMKFLQPSLDITRLNHQHNMGITEGLIFQILLMKTIAYKTCSEWIQVI